MSGPHPCPQEHLEVTDAYLAGWLAINGCMVVECTYSPNAGPLGCLMVFSGPRIHELHEQYVQRNARVELWEFRAASNRINQYVHEAKNQQARRGDDEGHEGGAS